MIPTPARAADRAINDVNANVNVNANAPDSAAAAVERRARARVRLKLGFATHALVYVLVNLGLVAAAVVTDGARGRGVPLWGWALGLTIHGAVVLANLYGEDLRGRMVAREVARLRRPG